MQKRIPVWLMGLAALGSSAIVTHADERGPAVGSLLSRVGPALGIVRLRLESEDGRRAELSLVGATVAPNGLTLIPVDSELLTYPRGFIKRIELIRPGRKHDPIECRLIGMNELVGAMFVEPAREARDQAFVDFNDTADAELGSPLIGLGLLGEGMGYRCSFELARAGPAIGDERFVLVGAGVDLQSLLWFNRDGKLAGMAAPPSIAEEAEPFEDEVPALGMLEQPSVVAAANYAPAVAYAIRQRRDWPDPWMGVAGLSMADRDICEAYGLSGETVAVVVGAVIEGFPAAKAGLKAKDFIIALNGQPLARGTTDDETLERYTRTMKRFEVGAPVRLTVWRDGARHELTLTLVDAPKSAAKADREFSAALGLSVREIVFNDRFNRRLEAGQGGVLVATLVQSGPADTADLSPGDIIHKLDETPIADLPAYRRALKEKLAGKPREMVLAVLRGTSEQLIVRVELSGTRTDAPEASDAAEPPRRPRRRGAGSESEGGAPDE